MKISWQSFLGKNHSWSCVSNGISRSLIDLQHDVELFSTNGTDHFPDDLKSNLVGYYEKENDPKTLKGRYPNNDRDLALSYTAFPNAQRYLSYSKKNRFLLWTYEFAGKNALPNGFAKQHHFTDLILSPSLFNKEVFVNSGIPEEKIKIIPHGVNFKNLEEAIPYQLKTKKSTKIGCILGQIHRRKNLFGLLEMYGKAFTNKDDVCLVLKIQDRPAKQVFELNFNDVFKQFKNKYPNHAEIEIIRSFIPNMFSIYKACDIIFSATHCEGFGMTMLEANALGLINIAPRYSGYLDFLNDDNSLLIEGKIFKVPPNYLYWQQKIGLEAFMPDINDGVEKLRYAVKYKDQLKKQYQSNIQKTKEFYDWNIITKNILSLVK